MVRLKLYDFKTVANYDLKLNFRGTAYHYVEDKENYQNPRVPLNSAIPTQNSRLQYNFKKYIVMYSCTDENLLFK